MSAETCPCHPPVAALMERMAPFCVYVPNPLRVEWINAAGETEAAWRYTDLGGAVHYYPITQGVS